MAVLDLNYTHDSENCGEITCFYCLPEYQRLGIGSKLFSFAKNKFILAGLQKFKIEVIKENIAGCNFCKKQGGKEVGNRDKLLSGKQVTFLTYEFEI